MGGFQVPITQPIYDFKKINQRPLTDLKDLVNNVKITFKYEIIVIGVSLFNGNIKYRSYTKKNNRFVSLLV